MSGNNRLAHAKHSSRNGMKSAGHTVFSRFTIPTMSLAMLGAVGFVSGVLPRTAAAAEPNHVFTSCTFTTTSLRAALTITDADLSAATLEASYILIYVRANPNDGQKIGTTTSFTGPVLCINEDTESIVETTESTQIPNSNDHPGAVSVDILGTEEALHLQYLLNFSGGPGDPPGDVEKRVCHTVAGNTDCFFIQPLPPLP
jgi:hypothetical protein